MFKPIKKKAGFKMLNTIMENSKCALSFLQRELLYIRTIIDILNRSYDRVRKLNRETRPARVVGYEHFTSDIMFDNVSPTLLNDDFFLAENLTNDNLVLELNRAHPLFEYTKILCTITSSNVCLINVQLITLSAREIARTLQLSDWSRARFESLPRDSTSVQISIVDLHLWSRLIDEHTLYEHISSVSLNSIAPLDRRHHAVLISN